MSTSYSEVYISSIDRWAVEMRFEQGVELLLTLFEGEMYILRYDDRGKMKKFPISDYYDALGRAKAKLVRLSS